MTSMVASVEDIVCPILEAMLRLNFQLLPADHLSRYENPGYQNYFRAWRSFAGAVSAWLRPIYTAREELKKRVVHDLH